MPHLRMRGVSEGQVAEISQTLIAEIAKAIATPEDYFTLEWVPTAFFQEGRQIEGSPFCEVAWFDRGQETQDHVAQIISRHLKVWDAGKDVVVVFTHLVKTQYYENGAHF